MTKFGDYEVSVSVAPDGTAFTVYQFSNPVAVDVAHDERTGTVIPTIYFANGAAAAVYPSGIVHDYGHSKGGNND